MSDLPNYKDSHPYLLESARIELACDYLVHELRKILPNSIYQEVYTSIKNQAPSKERDDDVTIRDFWNLFCALSSGWRLKDLYHDVTNKNIVWKKERVGINLLHPNSPQGWMKNITIYDFNKAIEYLQSGKNTLTNALEKTKKYRNNRAKEDENDPIITISKDGIYEVMDGNSRLAQKIENWVANGKNLPYLTLATWIGTFNNSDIPNYWIPTSSLFFVNSFRYTDFESKLKNISELAFIEFQKRIK